MTSFYNDDASEASVLNIFFTYHFFEGNEFSLIFLPLPSPTPFYREDNILLSLCFSEVRVPSEKRLTLKLRVRSLGVISD